MENFNPMDYLQLGGVFVISIFVIYQLFLLQKDKKDNKIENNLSEVILQKLNLITDNHLSHAENKLDNIYELLLSSNRKNDEIIKLLIEIKTLFNKI